MYRQWRLFASADGWGDALCNNPEHLIMKAISQDTWAAHQEQVTLHNLITYFSKKTLLSVQT